MFGMKLKDSQFTKAMLPLATKEKLGRTGVKDVIREMYDRKRGWAGHITRVRDDGRIVRMLYQYFLNVRRNQGAP